MSEMSILIVCRSGKYPEMPESTLTRSSEPFSNSITALGKLLSLVRMHSSLMKDYIILYSVLFLDLDGLIFAIFIFQEVNTEGLQS